MTKKKNKSPIAAEYAKQRRRIQSFIRRAVKRGYQFAENILPNIPKRITKASVSRLEKLTPEALYKKSEWIDKYSGQRLAGITAREHERSAAARQAARTRKQKLAEQSKPENIPNEADLILDNFRSRVLDLKQRATAASANYGKNFYNRMQEWTKDAADHLLSELQRVINKDGKLVVADRINKNAEQINRLLDIAMFDYREKGELALSTILRLIGATEYTLEDALKAAEMSESWGVGYEEDDY